jgi:ABC-type lipoprotein export system ATPase subunit
VFQLHHLFPQCTLYENVLLPTLPRTDKKQLQKRAEMLIRQTGLWERRNDKPSTLSGGECQRTAVARALINGPSLLLADEPTGALDEENATALISLLTEINKSMETTLIVVTHSKEIARRMDKVYRLTKGVLQAET